MYGIIYCARNLSNQKVYIGQTKQSLQTRISDHWCAARDFKRVRLSRNFIYALRAQPLRENWQWTVLAEANTKEELDQKEREWIAKLFACDPSKGYNLQAGGYGGAGSPKGSESYRQWKEKVDKSAPWKQPKDSVEYLRWRENCRLPAIQRRGIKVHCIELDKDFSNLKEAVNWMKQQNLGCGIRWALGASNRTAGGYHWIRKTPELY